MPKKEPILGDAVQIASGQLIVCDGVVKPATQAGTVSQLKTAMSATTIRAVDLAYRRGPAPMDE